MKRITAEVLSSGKALSRFKKIAKLAARGEKVEPMLGFDSMAELGSLLSGKRMELLRYVAQRPGLSIRQLSFALERDYKRVHTDVTDLKARGLLGRDSQGKLIAPYDEIVIRAPLRAAA
jgi:predicted transcriptional regulator